MKGNYHSSEKYDKNTRKTVRRIFTGWAIKSEKTSLDLMKTRKLF